MLETLLTTESIAILAMLVVFSAFSFGKKLLSVRGIIFADAVGIIAFALGGPLAAGTLLFFYVIAEAATRVAHKTAEHGQRTISNIFANSAAAIIALFFGQYAAFFGAVSAALADTVSSEIGMLSRKKPVLITSLREVEMGTNGGITVLGIVAGAVAASFIALIFFFTVKQSAVGFVAITLAGLVGTLFDSLLGAVFERKGMLNNTHVNLLAGIAGAMVALAFSSLI
ncbi:MAG: DUF92 domain-containing protein [archaeon]